MPRPRSLSLMPPSPQPSTLCPPLCPSSGLACPGVPISQSHGHDTGLRGAAPAPLPPSELFGHVALTLALGPSPCSASYQPVPWGGLRAPLGE